MRGFSDMCNPTNFFHTKSICRNQRGVPSLITFALLVLFNAGCHAKQDTVNYEKNGLVFSVPATWVVKEDYRAPGSRRSVSIETPETSLVLIEMYSKDVLLNIPEYQNYDASLRQFAKRYNSRDITGKLQSKMPITYVDVKREGFNGLKEMQKFQIADVVNETLIREYYRIDAEKEIVFIILDTSKNEYDSTETGINVILNSFKYN
jgi:hypothetical protein